MGVSGCGNHLKISERKSFEKYSDREGKEKGNLKPQNLLTGHQDRIYCCAISRDNSFIVSGSDDKTCLWDRESGKCFKVLGGHESAVRSCDIFENLILSASYDKTLKLWDSNGQELRTFKGHSSAIRCCRFSNSGRLFASGSYDHSVRVWRIEQTSSIKEFEGHMDSVYSCAWSSNDELLLSAGTDETLRVWHVEQETCLQTIKSPPDRPPVYSCCMFLFSDSHLLVGRYLYERKTEKVVQEFMHERGTTTFDCAVDGTESFFVTATANGESLTLAIYDIPKEMQRNSPTKEN